MSNTCSLSKSDLSKADFNFPVLVGDIGGTNARFGLVEKPGSSPQFLQAVKVADFNSPQEAILSVLPHFPEKPMSAFFAVAGQVESTHVIMTNASWVLDAQTVGQVCGFKSVALINDFPPVAASLLNLVEGKDLYRIGSKVPQNTGVRVVIGAGTGCGAAALIPVGDQLFLQPTEVGHTHLGSEGEEEMAIWPYLTLKGAPMSIETLISGAGFMRLYKALMSYNRQLSLINPRFSPDDVLEAAKQNEPIAKKTITLFLRLLARITGDLALIFQASGGVYIAGGIVPRFLDILDDEEFRSIFENKPPLQDYLAHIATYVVTEPFPALLGLAALASHPRKFVAPAFHCSINEHEVNLD